MDEVDRSQAHQQRELEAALSIRKRRFSLQAEGYCHNCYLEVEEGKLF